MLEPQTICGPALREAVFTTISIGQVLRCTGQVRSAPLQRSLHQVRSAPLQRSLQPPHRSHDRLRSHSTGKEPPSMRCENKLGPRAWVAMSLLFSVVSFAGCGSRDDAHAPAGRSSGREVPPPSPKRYTIAVIPKGETAEFWKSVHAGAIHAERELGNVDVKWQGPLREDNREEQIRVVETFVAQGVDGIVLAPLDRTALVRPVHEAIAGGTPVLIIDSGLDSNEILSYVATNNFNGGAMAARRLGELLGGKGNCILLRYQVGSQSTEERGGGVLAARRPGRS